MVLKQYGYAPLSLNSETGLPLGLEKLENQEKWEGISGQGKVTEI